MSRSDKPELTRSLKKVFKTIDVDPSEVRTLAYGALYGNLSYLVHGVALAVISSLAFSDLSMVANAIVVVLVAMLDIGFVYMVGGQRIVVATDSDIRVIDAKAFGRKVTVTHSFPARSVDLYLTDSFKTGEVLTVMNDKKRVLVKLTRCNAYVFPATPVASPS